MRATDIAAYFVKKIAKPIQFDLVCGSDHRFYAVEPTAVEDDVIHVLVSLKYEMCAREGEAGRVSRGSRDPLL